MAHDGDRPYRQREVTSFDGTVLSVQTQGEGPPVVLANGLGGAFTAWRHVVAALPRYRVLSWDYRGLYGSGPPARREAITIPDHARDLGAVLDAEGVDRAVLIGWSMGCQVLLEFCRFQARRVAGLVLINGSAGRPFDDVVPGTLGRVLGSRAIPRVLAALRRRADLAGRVARRAAAWPALVPAMVRLGLVSATLDMAVFADLAREFAGLDFDLYLRTLRQLGRHDARDLLPEIRVPSLVIAGSSDPLTPARAARALCRRMPHARLHVVEGGTHYTPVEKPAEVAREVCRYLAERGW